MANLAFQKIGQLACELKDATDELAALKSRRCDGCEHYGAEDTSEPDFFACWYPRGDGDFLYGVAVPHDFYCKHWRPKNGTAKG